MILNKKVYNKNENQNIHAHNNLDVHQDKIRFEIWNMLIHCFFCYGTHNLVLFQHTQVGKAIKFLLLFFTPFLPPLFPSTPPQNPCLNVRQL